MTKSARNWIWSHLLKKSLLENFIFCAVMMSWCFSMGLTRETERCFLYGISFDHFCSMFHFYTPENVRKSLVFWCFKGNRNRTLDKNGLNTKRPYQLVLKHLNFIWNVVICRTLNCIVALRKIPNFHLTSWCGKFVETYSFGRFTRNSAETVRFNKISTLGSELIVCYFMQ